MKPFIILCSLFLYSTSTYSQTSANHANMITCFSQGHTGSGATNCASVSVIKLVITKYGIHGAFLHIDSLADKYVVHLRNGHQTEITSAEIATMDSLDKFFVPVNFNPDTVKAAKFMYAVMAKNKFSEPARHFANLKAAATDVGGWLLHHYPIYQLEEDTRKNMVLIGLDMAKVDTIKAADVPNYSDIIMTSLHHSVYTSYGTYDEYGGPKPISFFIRKHGDINQQGNYILLD